MELNLFTVGIALLIFANAIIQLSTTESKLSDIMTFLNENVNAWEADYFDKLYSKFEGFDKPIQLRRSDFFKMALDSTIKIRKIMEKELEERCKKTYKDMEQYIDFKGENNGETSK